MDLERARTFLVSLPYVAEAEQFGGLIYWLGDKAIGGKMMSMVNFEGAGHCVSYPAGPMRFHELLELDGLVPAPYLARLHWVSAERWDVFRNAEWEEEWRAAHALTLAKLSPKTRKLLQLPKADLKRAVAERKKILAERKSISAEAQASNKGKP